MKNLSRERTRLRPGLSLFLIIDALITTVTNKRKHFVPVSRYRFAG